MEGILYIVVKCHNSVYSEIFFHVGFRMDSRSHRGQTTKDSLQQTTYTYKLFLTIAVIAKSSMFQPFLQKPLKSSIHFRIISVTRETAVTMSMTRSSLCKVNRPVVVGKGSSELSKHKRKGKKVTGA